MTDYTTIKCPYAGHPIELTKAEKDQTGYKCYKCIEWVQTREPPTKVPIWQTPLPANHKRRRRAIEARCVPGRWYDRDLRAMNRKHYKEVDFIFDEKDLILKKDAAQTSLDYAEKEIRLQHDE